MRLADWLPLLVFPGGLVVLTVACLWLSVGLVRQRRRFEAAVALVTFLGLACALWVLYRFFASP